VLKGIELEDWTGLEIGPNLKGGQGLFLGPGEKMEIGGKFWPGTLGGFSKSF